ncbi:hypothetical protein BC941DRAFT_416310 [Chlamydoabsidia padenii]|nr:hypothetical protein BC941DRAFT_416310 [Chlamydoabsidia padenii]
MSTVSSESDTPLDTQEHHSPTHGRHRSSSISNNSRRKSVIDTRRAEQNRAAQRAFRQRKELYVKELESKVQDMELLKDRVEQLEIENNQLKYRLWELESSSLPAITTTATTTNTTLQHSQSPSPSSSSHLRQDDLSINNSNSKDQQLLLQHHSTTNAEPSSSPTQLGMTTSATQQPILPPPSPSPSVFRPIPVPAYWDKDGNRHRPAVVTSDPRSYQDTSRRGHIDDDKQGRVLDDLASILRTRHRPPIHQDQQELMHT